MDQEMHDDDVHDFEELGCGLLSMHYHVRERTCVLWLVEGGLLDTEGSIAFATRRWPKVQCIELMSGAQAQRPTLVQERHDGEWYSFKLMVLEVGGGEPVVVKRFL